MSFELSVVGKPHLHSLTSADPIQLWSGNECQPVERSQLVLGMEVTCFLVECSTSVDEWIGGVELLDSIYKKKKVLFYACLHQNKYDEQKIETFLASCLMIIIF